MNKKQIEKFALYFDPLVWKSAPETIGKVLFYRQHNFKNRYHGQPPTPPDYRDLAKSILRAGVELSKEEKKRYGIHGGAKVTTSIFSHFTDNGLRDCIYESQRLCLALSGIENSLSKIEDCKRDGNLIIEFIADDSDCETCEKCKGVYVPEAAPIPILDTHIECLCVLMPCV